MRTQLLENYYNGEEYKQKLLERMEVMRLCYSDSFNIQRFVVEKWENDPICFIEQWGWISIPEFGGDTKPFFLFEYQKTIINKLHEAEMSGLDCEILIDKPRGMGLTWILVWYQVWRWIFKENWGGFNMSRTETEVDAGDADPNSSIFGKFRWCINTLPDFLIPEGFVPKGKKGTSTDSTLRITNPKLGSRLIGSTTNSNAGRSRRYSFILIDECFAIEQFNSVWRALQSVARVKVFISTVKAGKVFQDFKNMCQASGNYISLTWRDHPFKDDIWYNEQLEKAKFDPEVMKEVDVDYNISIKSQYYPEIRQAKTGPLQYMRDKPLYVSLDQGQGDLTVLIWWQFDGNEFRILECMWSRRKHYSWYIPFLNRDIEYNPDAYLLGQIEKLNRVRAWEKPNAFFGEAAMAKAESDNTSFIQKMVRDGKIRIIFNQYAIQYEPRRKASAEILPRTVFNSESDMVMELYDGISLSRYAGSIKGTSKETSLKPVHDPEISDFRSAFENGAVNIARILRSQRRELGDSIRTNSIHNLIKYLKV